jgi:hypothetical protein
MISPAPAPEPASGPSGPGPAPGPAPEPEPASGPSGPGPAPAPAPAPEPEPELEPLLPLADEEGSVALQVGPSRLAGLGLFATGPGKPAAIEYLMGGAPISAEEEREIWQDKLPGHEYLMSVAAVDDGGFRDETGRLRPKADVEAYIGRCEQELVWDDTKQEWRIFPPLNYVGKLEPIANPAAYANDALYQKLDGVTQTDEYARRDAELNALVMVPGLRRLRQCEGDSGDGSDAEFEFCSMWFYPRRGWQWLSSEDNPPDKCEESSDAANPATSMFEGEELTVGYYWPLFKRQPDAYAQFCVVA